MKRLNWTKAPEKKFLSPVVLVFLRGSSLLAVSCASLPILAGRVRACSASWLAYSSPAWGPALNPAIGAGVLPAGRFSQSWELPYVRPLTGLRFARPETILCSHSMGWSFWWPRDLQTTTPPWLLIPERFILLGAKLFSCPWFSVNPPPPDLALSASARNWRKSPFLKF